MKRIAVVLALAILLVSPAATEPQQGLVITITAGAAQRFATIRTMASSMLIQALHGGTGLVYVLNANPGITCTKGSGGTILIAELAPATATAPGGSFTFPSNNDATNTAGGFDIQYFCVDGSHSGDTVAVSWDKR